MEHETLPGCIMHGATIVKENDFLDNVCEEIEREREIQWVFFLFCPHEKWKCFFFFPPYKHNLEVFFFSPLQNKNIKVFKKFKLPHHPQLFNLCVCIKFSEGS
jgi:hypothetical protein